MTAPHPRLTIGYLSGALRVSTAVDAEASGPRSHVLGIIGAFRELGCDVRTYIAGDQVPRRVATDSRRALSGSAAAALAADLTRLALRRVNARRAHRAIGDDVDWVYERFASFQALGRPFQRRGIPWILETQGPFYEEAARDRKSMVLTGVARRLELDAYRRCDVLICVSDALRQWLVTDAGLPPGKVLVVPNGVDARAFDPAAHLARRSFDGFTIVYVGSLTGWQGVDLLLHAMHDLRDEVPAHLVVAGDGLVREPWQRLATDLGLAERVRFLGQLCQGDVPAVLAGAELGFAGHRPSRRGSVYHSPLKIYEYLAAGRPVLASASEDAVAVLREGETGFLFPPGDRPALADALRRAWQRRGDLAAMGRRGREEVTAHHTWRIRAGTIRDGVARVLVRA